MLKRLRSQFILTNTLYVGIVLIIVFILICAIAYNGYMDSLENTLLKAAQSEGEMRAYVYPDTMGSSDFIPYTVVKADRENGEVLGVFENGQRFPDSMLSALTLSALAGPQSAGELKNDIHYSRVEKETGTFIAFASAKYVHDSLKELIKLLALIGVCAIALVIAVSFPVAKGALLSTENAWEQQKRFIADASHALKTPLTVILANIGILKAGHLKEDEEALHWLISTEEEASGMHDLIREMLVLAQSDLNVRRTDFTNVNLSNLIMGQILQFEAVAFDKGITLETDVEDGVEMRGNEKALAQMFSAIIENAFKYEKNNGLVRIKLDKQVRKIVLTVYNASTFISNEERERIFDRFCRLKTPETRAHEGHGLGLSIARSVADVHQAVIDVESSREGGTAFKVTFRHIL